MIIISKKRLLTVSMYISFAIIITLGAVFNNKTLETAAIPVTNKIIVLDAGHGYPDGGAVSVNNVSEENINLKIALKLQKLLEQSGATVILTRSDENGIYDLESKTLREKKVSDIKNRVKIGNESEADIFVSIHLNKIPEEKYWGWQTFFKENNEKSKMLAEGIQEGINETIQKENKRESLKIRDIYIIENIEIPTAIIECGFLSNKEEEELLQRDEYQDKLAWGIYSGIIKYFNISEKD